MSNLLDKMFSAGFHKTVVMLACAICVQQSAAHNDQLFWSFETTINENVTDEFPDDSGNNQRAEATLPPSFVNRPLGGSAIESKAVSFIQNGQPTTQELSGGIFALSLDNPFAISFWLKTSSGEQNILSRVVSGRGLRVSINTSNEMVLSLSDGEKTETFSTPFQPYYNRWVHVTYVISKEGVFGFLDGQSMDLPVINDFDLQLDTYSAPLKLGDAAKNIKGAIDDVRMFNRHITPIEVTCLAQDGFECVRPISIAEGDTGEAGRKVTSVEVIDEGETLEITYDNPSNIGELLFERIAGIKGDQGIKGVDGSSVVNIKSAFDQAKNTLEVSLELGFFNGQCMGSFDSQGQCSKRCQQTYCVTETVSLGNVHGEVDIKAPGDEHVGVGIEDIKLGARASATGSLCNVEPAENAEKNYLCYKLTNSTEYRIISNDRFTGENADRFRGLDQGVKTCPMTQGAAGLNSIHFKSDSSGVLIETKMINNEPTQVVGVYFKDRNGNESLHTYIPYADIKGAIGDVITVAPHNCNVMGEDGNHGIEVASWRGGSIDDEGKLTLKKRLANGSISDFNAMQVRADGADTHGFEHFYHYAVGNVPSNQRIYYPARFNHATKECQVFIAVPSDFEKDAPFSYSTSTTTVNGQLMKWIDLNYERDTTGMRYVLVCAMK